MQDKKTTGSDANKRSNKLQNHPLCDSFFLTSKNELVPMQIASESWEKTAKKAADLNKRTQQNSAMLKDPFLTTEDCLKHQGLDDKLAHEFVEGTGANAFKLLHFDTNAHEDMNYHALRRDRFAGIGWMICNFSKWGAYALCGSGLAMICAALNVVRPTPISSPSPSPSPNSINNMSASSEI